jgi:nucleoside-diphosphate-sugar epimerase
MKALVTGGTGFIGSAVVDRLVEAGHSVRIFSRNDYIPERLKGKDVEIFKGDLGEPGSVVDAVSGMDIFYHIGEIKNITRAASEKNVKLVEHITRALDKAGVRRLVFVSSLTVSGIPSRTPADENTPPQTILKDHYTSYKRKCEELIVSSSSGFEYSIVRPAPVYGPGSRYLPRLIRTLEKIGPLGLPFIGNAKNNAPLIYVKDLARAVYLTGIEGAAAGEIFNLTDGIPHSWFDFFNEIAGDLGKKVRILPLPPMLLKLPALPLDLFSGFFGLEFDPVNYLNYFSRDIFFSNKKACELLPWEPEYTLEEGIREMVQSYRSKE